MDGDRAMNEPVLWRLICPLECSQFQTIQNKLHHAATGRTKVDRVHLFHLRTEGNPGLAVGECSDS